MRYNELCNSNKFQPFPIDKTIYNSAKLQEASEARDCIMFIFVTLEWSIAINLCRISEESRQSYFIRRTTSLGTRLIRLHQIWLMNCLSVCMYVLITNLNVRITFSNQGYSA